MLIEFEAAVNSEILLTGIILEPADEESILSTVEEIFTEDDEVLFAEAVIADAVGETFDAIVSEAGDESEIEDILDLEEPEDVDPDRAEPERFAHSQLVPEFRGRSKSIKEEPQVVLREIVEIQVEDE